MGLLAGMEWLDFCVPFFCTFIDVVACVEFVGVCGSPLSRVLTAGLRRVGFVETMPAPRRTGHLQGYTKNELAGTVRTVSLF